MIPMNAMSLALLLSMSLLATSASADVGVSTEPDGFMRCEEAHQVPASASVQVCVVTNSEGHAWATFATDQCATLPDGSQSPGCCPPGTEGTDDCHRFGVLLPGLPEGSPGEDGSSWYVLHVLVPTVAAG